MTAPQVFDVTHLIDFYYGVTWSLERKDLFTWKDEEPGNFERKVKRFFARERFLRMLAEWIVVFRKDDDLRKVVLRQHQTRAVERVVERALDPEKRTSRKCRRSTRSFRRTSSFANISRHTQALAC